jgi:pimeloyl-ACP methyl ester carboxylesterase
MPAETWILIRGLTREAAHWGEFVSVFEEEVKAEVRTLDLPGAGTRHREAWPTSVREAMEMMRAEARPSGRTFVFGVSLGGMITMEWAARHPQELAGVVIGASSARDLATPWQRMRPRALVGMAASLRGELEAREAAVVRVVSNRRDRWTQTTERWIEIARQRPVSRRTARGQIVAAARWSAPWVLPVPSLFLVGTEDRLVDAECSRALARRFGAPLREHASAGHDLTTDEPEWVVRQIAQWRATVG